MDSVFRVQQNENSNMLSADEEDDEDYNAFNDETFGGEVTEDWVQDEYEEKESNPPSHGKEKDWKKQREPCEELVGGIVDSINHMVFDDEDELDDPAIMNISRSNPIPMHCKGVRTKKSPPLPTLIHSNNVGSPQLSSIWSTSPQRAPPGGQDIHPKSPSVKGFSQVRTVEDLERDLLSNSPIKPQTLEEIESKILGKSPASAERDIVTRLRQNSGNSGTSPHGFESPPRGGMWPHHSNMSPTLSTSPYARPQVPPNTLPFPNFGGQTNNNYSQPSNNFTNKRLPPSPNVVTNGKGDYSSPIHPVHGNSPMQPGHGSSPMAPGGRGGQYGANFSPSHDEQHRGYNKPQYSPSHDDHRHNNRNYSPGDGGDHRHMNGYGGRGRGSPHGGGGDYYHQRVNRKFSFDDNTDPYAGLMTGKEKSWLISIQLNQLHTDNPHIDDYYYIAFSMKQAAAAKGEECGPELCLPERSSNKESKEYTPTLMLNTLGKLSVGSVIAPRKMLDVTPGNHVKESQTDAYKEKYRYRHILLEIEELFTLMLDLEDLSKRLPLLPDGELRSRIKAERDTAIHQLRSALTVQERLYQLMSIHKGKVLLLKTFKLLEKKQKLLFVCILVHKFSSICMLDSAEPLLQKLLVLSIHSISLCDLQDLTTLYTTPVHTRADTTTEVNFNALLTNKMGLSVVLCSVSRGATVYTDCTDTEVKTSWCKLMVELTAALSSLPELPPALHITPSSLTQCIQHLHEFPIQADVMEKTQSMLKDIKHQ